MSTTIDVTDATSIAGQRIALVGKLSGMSKRDAQQLIRQHGGLPVELPVAGSAAAAAGSSIQLIVVGDDLSRTIDSGEHQMFDGATCEAIDAGKIAVMGEHQFWQRLGLVEGEDQIRRLYTPAMLAELIGVPVAVVRRWHRRGLIKPVREVRRLPYFDFQEVATARRLAELLASGMKPAAIERRLAELARYVPGVDRPLAQLSVIVRGGRILLRQGDGLVAPGGQLFFDFDLANPSQQDEIAGGDSIPRDRSVIPLAQSLRMPTAHPEPDDMLSLAADLEDDGDLAAAVEAYRAHAAAAGPTAPVCFAMAELLYRLGDTAGARERYYMAIELDEDYVEARANLGCVLVEQGETELAIAAFEGALVLHAGYADARFHLAHTLDDLNRRDEATHHWREFLRLAPESPWAAIARERLGLSAETV